jgi:L-lactate dehydrogenase complex protein LldG
MNSREQILKAVAANKPASLPLPALPSAFTTPEPFVRTRKFITILEGIGGKVNEVDGYAPVQNYLADLKRGELKIACTSASIGIGNFTVTPAQTALELEQIDTAFMTGEFGVAENGAVWLYESQFVNRLLPFICQHLVIVLDSRNVLSDMHEAYSKIDVQKEGYSLFLAGPSKTADIEQSLVIGAHGARSATIYLVNNL